MLFGKEEAVWHGPIATQVPVCTPTERITANLFLLSLAGYFFGFSPSVQISTINLVLQVSVAKSHAYYTAKQHSYRVWNFIMIVMRHFLH